MSHEPILSVDLVENNYLDVKKLQTQGRSGTMQTQLLIALFGLLASRLVTGDITGQNPAAGTCICLDNTGVNVRSTRQLIYTVIYLFTNLTVTFD